MMKSLLEVFGDRRCCIARELTKVHEEFLRGTVSELIPELDGLKGEMVVIVEGNTDDYSKDVDSDLIMKMLNESQALGMTASDAVKDIAKKTGIPKNTIYRIAHQCNN
jgi:16S rRNA (cytidine1402-2'-O)-methyltransferase